MTKPFILFLGFLLCFFVLSPTVHAQQCRGGDAGWVRWGNNYDDCRWSGTGDICKKSLEGKGPFGKLGSCVCKTSCFTNAAERCADYDNECAACAQTNSDKSAYDCSSGTCTWNGSPATCALCATAWQNQSCGAGSCSSTQMRQFMDPQGRNLSTCGMQFRCVDDATCSPPPPVPTTPTITTSSCSYPTNSSTIAWTAPAGATYYLLRINDSGFSSVSTWDGSCSTPGNPNGGQFCDDAFTGNSYTFTGITDHNYGWWVHACNASGCSGSTSSNFSCTPTPTPTDTPTPTLTPTPTIPPPAISYFKLKSASFYKLGTLTSIFPSTIVAYDASDDITGEYFNQGPSAGVVVSQTGTITAGGNSGSNVSQSGWKRNGQNIPSSFNSATFKAYMLTKKAMTRITNPNISAISSAGVYYYDGDLDNLTTGPSADNVLLLVNGNVTVAGIGAVNRRFNSLARPFALVVSGSSSAPKTLTFDDSLTSANGVFVADKVAFSTNFGSTTPLKIVGNVTSYTGVSMSPMTRARNSNTNAPSLFIVFDPTIYMSIFNQLSTVKSSWTQIQ